MTESYYRDKKYPVKKIYYLSKKDEISQIFLSIILKDVISQQTSELLALKMWGKQFFDIALVIFVTSLSAVVCAPQKFNTKSFKVGIEYDRKYSLTDKEDKDNFQFHLL